MKVCDSLTSHFFQTLKDLSEFLIAIEDLFLDNFNIFFEDIIFRLCSCSFVNAF